MQAFAADLSPISEPASFPPAEAAVRIGGLPAYGSGVGRLAGLASDLHETLPDARDVPLLPPALAGLPLVPLYCRAPDALLPGARR